MSHRRREDRDSGYERAVGRVRSIAGRLAAAWFLFPPVVRNALLYGGGSLLGLGWLTAGGDPDKPLHGLQQWGWLMDWLCNIPLTTRYFVFGCVGLFLSVRYIVNSSEKTGERTRESFKEVADSFRGLIQLVIKRQDESDARIDVLWREVNPSGQASPAPEPGALEPMTAATDSFPSADDPRWASTARSG